MRDTAVGRYCEDAKSCDCSQHAEQRLGLYTALRSQGVDGNAVIWRDSIGNPKVGNQTKHP
jgi:hypothetical protein